MRRAYDHPSRANDPIPRREPSPSRSYVDSYTRSGREFRRRDGPNNHYSLRYHGYGYYNIRSSSPRGHRGPPSYEDSRYSNSRHSPERWRPQNRDYGNRNYDGYRRPYERNSPRYPSDRDYGNRSYDGYRRPQYDDRYPRRDSSRSRGDDAYYRRTPPPRPREPANPCKLFIGNVPIVTTVDDLVSLFGKYGEVVKCDLHKRFAFIEFTRVEDANTALEKMNDFSLFGERLKVHHHTERSSKNHDNELKTQYQKTTARRKGFPVTVANIEETTSWQDLKDFGRLAGEVVYASIVIKDGKKFGVIEFLAEESVKIALENLQGKQLGKNKLEIIEGSLIGNPNSRLDEIQAQSELPSDQEKPKDEDNAKDFDDDANAVDYKSE